MDRRAFLTLGAAGIGLVAGCAGDSQPDTPASTGTATPTPTSTQSTPKTSRDHPNTIFVAPDGTDTDPGSQANPLRSIQQGLNRAQPGDTIQVQPGRYQPNKWVKTVRAGTAENPITITGPADAVYNGSDPFIINHSHVHLTGLTFDGLVDPDNPDDPESYSWGLLEVNGELHDTITNGEYGHDTVPDEQYLRDIVVKPHAVGNCTRDFIKVNWARDVEIGAFRIIGPAGIDYLKGDVSGHNGEVVYLGNPPDKGYPVDGTHNVHIHHIDNSAGYPHAELVDVKAGCHDVLIEYCTDGGGAGRYVLDGHDATSEPAIHLGGRDCTLRWNRITGSHGQGVEVASWGVSHPRRFKENTGVTYPAVLRDHGRANAIYGNRITEYDGLAIQYPVVYPDEGEPHIADGYGPDEQALVCGNEIDGATHGQPTTRCPDSAPTTNTIGHLGGNSPHA